MFELVRVEVFQGEQSELQHISENTNSFVHKVKSALGEDMPYMLAVNIIVAGKPKISVVTYYARDPSEQLNASKSAHGTLFQAFLQGDDAFRNARLKLIPFVPEGPWVVRKSVGKRPLIVAKALAVNYYSRPNYMEIVADTSTDPIGSKVTGLCRQHIWSIVVDIAILLEGKDADELPEAIFGAARYQHLDLSLAKSINTSL